MEMIKLILIEIAILIIVMQFVFNSLAVSQMKTTNISTDQLALLSLKDHVSDPGNMISSNWSEFSPVCNWFGVTCNRRHGRVAALNLRNLGLIGTIPSQVGNLSFLVYLDLSNNGLRGIIPNELSRLRRLNYMNLGYNNLDGDVPGWLGSLAKLRKLGLSTNKFSGPLPVELSNLTILDGLDLSANLLTGNVPKEWGISFGNLTGLVLANNTLTGQFPSGVLNMSSLEWLSFSNNNLSGPIPEDIGLKLSNLKLLYLRGNNMDGRIPTSIKLCSNLQELSLPNNKLSGPIPREIGNLTNLRGIYLEDNNLQGPIPETFGNLNRLEALFLESNKLTGTIPSSIFNLTALETMTLNQNQISGTLPSNMGLNTNNLQYILVADNLLYGILPASLSNASNLVLMEFSFNKLSGDIPDSLGDLEFLQKLNLIANNLSIRPSFFTSISKCKSLELLWLDGNPLNVNLPESIDISSNSSIQYLSLFDCGLRGMVPKEIGKMRRLIELSISSNHLSGEIPSSIGNLFELQMVDAADNQLGGWMPSAFCNLSYLGKVDLTNNKISGALPSCLGNVTTLRYLMLSSNYLTSGIPRLLWSLNDLLVFNLSSNFLDGSLHFDIGNMKQLISLDLSSNKFSGEIPSSIGLLMSLEVLRLPKNMFGGLIPESLGKVVSLKQLDLSYNNLVGVIPKSFEALQQLESFNVSYNRLSGEIPHKGRFETFKNDSFLGDNELCGEPLFVPCQQAHHHRSRKIKVLGIVLGSIASASLLLMLMIALYVKQIRARKSSTQNDVDIPKMHERVSYYYLQRVTNGFSENNLLGSGSFGSVYKGTLLDGNFWAIKVFDMKKEDSINSFERECEVLRSLRHRNLTQVITSCSSPDFKALVLEYMPNGSLETWLHSSDQVLDILKRLDIMIDVACALEYLHHEFTSLVVHSDLKPSNILLDEDMVAHVSDFGISKLFNDGESFILTETMATLGYMAPEYGLDGRVSTQCDVYSYGVVLMEVFTGRRPSDSIFAGDITLRSWVEESIPNSLSHIVDRNLLQHGGEHSTTEGRCLCAILELALNCSNDSPQHRGNMKDVGATLRKVRLAFLAPS